MRCTLRNLREAFFCLRLYPLEQALLFELSGPGLSPWAILLQRPVEKALSLVNLAAGAKCSSLRLSRLES